VASPGAPGQPGSGAAAGGQGGVAGIIATIDLSSAIDDRGVVQREIRYSDPGGTFNLLIPANTIALDRDHKPLRQIDVELLGDHPIVPDDRALLGQALEFSPSGATFTPPIRISLGYDTNDVPDGLTISDLDLAFFDSDHAQWVNLDGSTEPATSSVSANTGHFTSFGVITRTPPAVNWPLTAGILALEIGLGVAGFVFITRRRRLATMKLPAEDTLFAPAPAPEVSHEILELPPPVDGGPPGSPGGVEGKVDDHAIQT
jgi:hypothetical protein